MDCEKARKYMAEYIDQNLDDNIKEEVDSHLSSCESCFNEIKKLDSVTWKLECDSRSIKTPADFLQGMEEKAVGGIKPHIRIPGRVIISSLAAITAAVLLISYIVFVPQNFKYRLYNTVTSGKVYSTEYGTFGRKLNISSTSNNIKITVTKVAADDLQTIIYLKTEGSAVNGYGISDGDVLINGKQENSPGRGIVENTIDRYISKLILDPIETDRQTLNVTLKGLHESVNKSDKKIDGTWTIAVPVEKLKSRVYNIDRTVNLGEDNICFKSLTVGSTCTRIEYCFPDRNNMNIMEAKIINGAKEYDAYGYSSAGNGQYNTVDFETIYPDNPENFKVNIKEYCTNTMLKDNIMVTINLKNKHPVEFDYMGNTIKIENIKINGSEAVFDLLEPDKPRNYTDLNINCDYNEAFMSMNTADYCAADENGRVYDYNDYLSNYTKYKGKSVVLYPVKTVVSLDFPSGLKDQFKLYIDGSQNIIPVNKIVTLK